MSKIEWTEKTWNPTTGCTKVSSGCKNCYAEAMHKRLNAMGAKGYEKPFSEVVCHNDRLSTPLKRKKPTTYFVNSMSDLFNPDVPDEFIMNVFEVMAKTPQHTYQILTKNHQRMSRFFFRRGAYLRSKNIRSKNNVWLGVSVETIKEGVERIGWLGAIKDGIYQPRLFLSIEPLLEDLGDIELKCNHIDWVIVGGESGNNARPMKKHWVLNIKRQCKEQDVPFFFKQWGAYGEDGVKRSKKANGCLIDGVEYRARP
jgi:protein gp37